MRVYQTMHKKLHLGHSSLLFPIHLSKPIHITNVDIA
jgi:hypothetical protein